MKKITFLILLLFSLNITAQLNDAEQQKFNFYNDSLKLICKKLFTSKSDLEKKKYNQELISTFQYALNTSNSFEYPFDSLSDIAFLTPSDKTFRIINWNIPNNDGTQEYFGFIQRKHIQVTKKRFFKKEKTETILLFPLIDKSIEIKNPENGISDHKKWFGMLYYKIISKKSKKYSYYTLLAWDGNDQYSLKKIIDVLTFDEKGMPHFGADIFVMQKKYPKRIIFEYDATCTMSLKYNSKKDIIVFDHLAPTQPQLEGQFQYYCTDMSYDGFVFKNGKWNYITDVDITNEKDAIDKFYNDPHNKKATKSSNNIIIRDNKKNN